MQIAMANAAGHRAYQHLAGASLIDVDFFDGQRLIDFAKDRGLDFRGCLLAGGSIPASRRIFARRGSPSDML
jgi:hypothetical protein